MLKVEIHFKRQIGEQWLKWFDSLTARCLSCQSIAWAATRTRVLNAWTAYLASQGLTMAAYERWAARMESLLTGRALYAAQVRSALRAAR